MRLFSLAVVAGLLAVGFTYAADEKKPEVKKPADGEKKPEVKKPAKVMGTLSKIDGMKLTVTMKGDGGEKAVEFTTTDKTKFFQEEAAAVKPVEKKEGDKPVEKKPDAAKADEKKPVDEKKPEVKKEDKKPAPKRTEIKLADLKTGARVAVMAGEDKVATEVVVLPAAAPKKEKTDK